MHKQKIIIHGIGKAFAKVEKEVKLHFEMFDIVEIWDNDLDICNSKVVAFGKEYIIKLPHPIPLDVIVVISSDLYYTEIVWELQAKFHLLDRQLKRRSWLRLPDRKDILMKYRCSENQRVKESLAFMEDNPAKITSYNQKNLDIYDKNMSNIKINVQYDDEAQLFFVDWYGRRLYMKHSLNTADKVKGYVISLYKEQHPDSPHCYIRNGYGVKTGDVILDGGAAEGFWALENIEKANHVYLVESDKEWIKALQFTFREYRSKVEIISKWLGSSLDDRNTTIDTLNLKYRINYIKLDIEGAEEQALKGAKQTLMQDDIALVVCTYHKENDEVTISSVLEEYGFETVKGSGVMWFLEDLKHSASLRNGLLFAQKGRQPKIYIWGMGKCCPYVYSAVKKENCRLMGIVDTNRDKQYTIYEDVIVCPPEELDLSADYVIISARTDVVVQNIVAECKQMNFDRDHIICFWKDDLSRLDFLDARVRQEWEMQAEIKCLELKLENYPYEHGLEKKPQILPAAMLLKEMLSTGKSLARFGDGEFEIILGRNRAWFQDKNESRLSEHLREILLSNKDNVIIAIADNYGNLDKYTEQAAQGIREYMKFARQDHMNLLPKGKIFYDAYASRPYIIYQDKGYVAEIFELWKKLFREKSILIIEGEYSAFGYGNDLLDGAKSVRRILAPSRNAYTIYYDIVHCVKNYLEMSDGSIDLILISLGAVATCLAYDLADFGIQSIDIGQLDNEYEWYLRGSSVKVPIPNKLVAEYVSTIPENMATCRDVQYQKEIVARVGI